MTTAIILRRQVSVNGTEHGANIHLAVSAVKATGELVQYVSAHPRAGWPESPARYRARVRHETHLSAVARRIGA